jgi:hypothetical protein
MSLVVVHDYDVSYRICPKCGENVENSAEHYEIEVPIKGVDVKVQLHPECWVSVTGEGKSI